MTLAPGARLSSYEILESIGAGGMGEVYKARDTKLGREVAIKVLPEAFAENKERLARFEREARLLASLNHPNIATIYDLEESDGIHFLVLEFVPGETLAERIKRGAIPIDEALPLFKQIAEGLEAAHEKGVIHRDLKPANIKVTPEGKVKVLDFGLAKALAAETPTRDLSESPTLTRDATEAGILLGTAPYMSPEQARGKSVDKRADVWAFGCILYEALTGKAAYRRETVSDTLVSILEHEPDWTPLPGTTPTAIFALLRRCLQKDTKRRFRDMWDVRVEIEDTLVQPTTARERVSRKRYSGINLRERLAWITTAVLLAVTVGLLYLLMQTREERAIPRRLVTIATGTPSGVYYPIGVGIAQVVEEKLQHIDIEVLQTDGSYENVKLLDQGDADLAMAQNDVVFNSVKTDLVLGHRNTSIRGVAVLYEEVAHIVVAKSLRIKSVHDIRGKTVDLSLPQSGSRFSSGILLSHFGIDVGDIIVSSLGLEEAPKHLLDGSLAGMITWSGMPDAAFTELFRTGNVELISIDRHDLDGLRIKQPFLIPVTIPPRVYPNQDMPISTIAVKAMLVASLSADAEIIEDILQVIFNSIPDLVAHHPRASDISLESAFHLEDGMPIDLHPGAERFFRSKSQER